MEAGFVLTGGTFDEHLKSTRICLRSAQPLPWRGETSVEVFDLTANSPCRSRVRDSPKHAAQFPGDQDGSPTIAIGADTAG